MPRIQLPAAGEAVEKLDSRQVGGNGWAQQPSLQQPPPHPQGGLGGAPPQ